MSDISKAQQTSLDIFKAIMNNGSPLTLYSANSITRIPIGTIHRHFKMLEETARIRPYQTDSDGRKKKEYGPTLYGITMCYITDKEFAKKAENYFLIWIENDEFKKELAVAGFDTNLEILKKSKHVFKKYLDYFGAIEEQIERIKNGTDAVSHEIMTYIGTILLSSKPRYQKMWTDLYHDLPGMQKRFDDNMRNMTNSYANFTKTTKN